MIKLKCWLENIHLIENNVLQRNRKQDMMHRENKKQNGKNKANYVKIALDMNGFKNSKLCQLLYDRTTAMKKDHNTCCL